MPHGNTRHEVLIAVFQVRRFPDTSGTLREEPELGVLLWQRALDPQVGTWSLPGGQLRNDEDLTTSARRQLAEKVDVRKVAHLEQLSVFSDPDRVPGPRTIAATYLGLIPLTSDPQLPADTAWHPVSDLPEMSFDHGVMVANAMHAWPRSCRTRTSRSASRRRSSPCRLCATSIALHWDTRWTLPIFKECWRAGTYSPAPATPHRPEKREAAPRRSTASPIPGCA